MRNLLLTICLFIISISAIDFVEAFSTEDLVRLKNARIEDETIILMEAHRTVETRYLTVEDVLKLKQAGIEDATIRLMITQGSFFQRSQTIVYGKDVQPLRLASVNDLLTLKSKGVSDEVLQAIILASGGRDSESQRRAWEMLRNMNIRIRTDYP
jgi:hypothetical protein